MAWLQSTRAMNCSVKKQGAVTYSMDQEHDVSKMIIIIISQKRIELESTPQCQAVCTLEYRLLNQPITAHILPER